jgi:hypothetical protein
MISKQTTTALFLAALMVGFTGCVGTLSFPTIEPISYKPSGMSPTSAVLVDSLKPTFKWKQQDLTEKMDLAVWFVGPNGAPGELYYSEEGIWGGQQTMQKPLAPGVEYFWSVKKSSSSVWATADYVGVSPIGAAWGKGYPFKIKAPSK